MKQNSGDQRCIAIVAALATASMPSEFENFIKSDPPYSEHQFSEFLFSKGLACSLGFGRELFYDDLNVTDSLKEEVLPVAKQPLNKDTEITMTYKIGDYPALFIVEAEVDNEKNHAIYWNGERVFDPNPMTPNNRSLSSYKILNYFPIINLRD